MLMTSGADRMVINDDDDSADDDNDDDRDHERTLPRTVAPCV